MSAESAARRGDAASKGLFAAATAVNAIPIAGQFAAAGLAIAGLFTKLFAGKRQAKKEKKRQAERDRLAKLGSLQAEKGAAVGAPAIVGGAGAQGGQPISATMAPSAPDATSFQTWGGGNEPTVVSPAQQAVNNKIGLS